MNIFNLKKLRSYSKTISEILYTTILLTHYYIDFSIEFIANMVTNEGKMSF